jgi:hypothetical protein
VTARTGMTTLIDTVRGMTLAGTADYTAGTLTFWDDTEIQRVLDRHKIDLRGHVLQSRPDNAGAGTVEYLEFLVGYSNLESGTPPIFELEYTTGGSVGTALYSVDYARGIVTFAADTAGTAFQVNASAYDLNASAADIWTMKGAYYATSYDFSTDNHSFSRSQITKQCTTMAQMYNRLADSSFGGGQAILYRGDT